MELALRLHNIVAALSLDERSSWSMQAALAKMVVSVTGALLPSDFTSKKDIESAGNKMDTVLSQYRQQLHKAVRSQKRSERRAVKAGRQPAPDTRVSELRQRIYRCGRGCTPPGVLLPSASYSCATTPALHKQPTRWTEVNSEMQYRRMQEELVEKRRRPTELPRLEGLMRIVVSSEAVSARAKVKAEIKAESARNEAS